MYTEVLLFALVGTFLFRAGMPSIAFLLVGGVFLLPFFPGYAVLGLVGATLAYWSQRPTFFPPSSLLIGFCVAMMGLGLFVLFREWIYVLEFLIPILLLGAAAWVTLHYLPRPELFFLFACAILALGWQTLHVWTIPLALPAWFVGFFGADWGEEKPSSQEGTQTHFLHAFQGVALGFLPGLGPGLAGALWATGKSSLSLMVSNLIFSLGFVLIEHRVRSFPAAWLVFEFPPHFEIFFLLLAAALCISWGFWPIFHFAPTLPPLFWVGVQWFFLLLAGGLLPLALAILSFSTRKAVDFYHLPPSLGMWVLILPIVWFYA